MHSGSPAEAIVRLREMGLPAYQVTSTLRGVLSQRLMRTVCPACTKDAQRTDCTICAGTNYAGRSAIGQLVEMTGELRQAIARGADVQELEQLVGTDSLRNDAKRLVSSGQTDADEVRRVLGG